MLSCEETFFIKKRVWIWKIFCQIEADKSIFQQKWEKMNIGPLYTKVGNQKAVKRGRLKLEIALPQL